jgi:large subunit ribosomal protein L9
MAKQIELLLREHVENLGRCGEIVSVRAGYASNFLLPKKLGVFATTENRRVIARRAARIDAEEEVQREALAGTAEAINNLTVTTLQKADYGGHLYGSVNAAQVVELCSAAGVGVEEGKVRLPQPIKEVGTHEVPIHLFAGLVATVTVVVESENPPPPPPEPKPEVAADSEDGTKASPEGSQESAGDADGDARAEG